MFTFHTESKLLNLVSVVQNNLLRATDNVIVRMYFTGDSMENSGKEMVASKTPDGAVDQLQFSGKIVIAEGTDYPASYNIPIYLYDVTEDNYLVEYWTDSYIMNDKNPNHHFTYRLCKPSVVC